MNEPSSKEVQIFVENITFKQTNFFIVCYLFKFKSIIFTYFCKINSLMIWQILFRVIQSRKYLVIKELNLLEKVFLKEMLIKYRSFCTIYKLILKKSYSLFDR